MLPGINGSLVAGSFLEDVLCDEFRADLPSTPPFARLHRWWKRVNRMLGPASSARAVLDVAALPLMDLLGYNASHLEPHGDGFVGTFGGTSNRGVVLRTTTWGAEPDAAWRDTVRAGRAAGAGWGLVYTGPTLRIVDASRTWSRRTLDFDLGVSLLDERSATALWTLSRCAALDNAQGQTVLGRIVERSDRHGVAVCASLGDGVLDALTALFTSLDQNGRRRRGHDDRDTLEQAVTIVYRMLFLLFAEARALVPTWHRVYRDAYTIDALCRRSTERRRPVGLWQALQAIARVAHAGCRAGDLIVTPFNGRLFSPHHTPLAERARIPDALVGRAVIALATGSSAHGRRRISYADLGVEQLGAVYERVLEYEPQRGNGPLVLTRTSHERKTTGSFYTPRAMTEFLVRRTLHPLVAGRTAGEILNLRVLDPAMGSGAFLVAACRYLAQSAERALVAQGEWPPHDNARARRADLRRVVAQRCLYGVDLNPMAVQLARLSLWLTSLTGDRPLTFLDHHLATGDSLLGARLDDLARGAPGHKRPPPMDPRMRRLFDDEAAEQMAVRVLPDRIRLTEEPGETPTAVRDKERILLSLVAAGAPLSRWKAAADLWCAAWLWPGSGLSPGVYGDVLASLLDQHATLSERQRADVMGQATTMARQHRFFHWDLEFPEVFFDADGRRRPDGGFDAVIGNPPWDVIRADTGDRAARDRMRTERGARLRFFRDARVYRRQGTGHANRYQLFLERALQLTRANGRVGLILPSGLATDTGSAPLRRALLDSAHIDRLIGFDNRRAIFPIHRDVKFLLLTATMGGRTEHLACTFGRSQPEWLDELPDAVVDDPPQARAIVLSRSLLESWDHDHLSFPLLSDRADLEILAQVRALVAPLSDVSGWQARFGRELNATEDKPHFVSRAGHAATRRSGDGWLLTVFEGKHLEPFRVLSDASSVAIPAKVAATLVDPERTYRRRRLAYRDVASATNRLTLIAALLPAGSLSTHTVFCLKTRLGDTSQYCLLGLLNSLVANYLVRLQVTTHVTTTLMARLPVPRPRSDTPPFRELASLARSLERTGVAADEAAYVRVNTLAAQLYGLTPEQYTHVVGTFPLLPETLRESCIRDYGRATGTRRHGEI